MTLRSRLGFLLRASLFLGALAGLFAACGKQQQPATLEIEYSGCFAFYPPDQCSLAADRQLTLWVRTTPPDRKVELHAGGLPLKPTKEEKVSDGRRYLLSIPKPADRLTVEVLSPDGDRGTSWFLRLAEPEQPSWWKEVNDLIKSPGKRPEARRRLEQIQKSAPHQERSFTWLPLANLAHVEGNSEQEELYLKEGIAADRSENRWSGVATKEPRLAALYIAQGRFGDAGRILQALQPPPKAAAYDKCNLTYNIGVLAEKSGNYATALKRLQETADLAQRVGLLKFARGAGQMLALVYQELGRLQEASKMYVKLLADPDLEASCDVGILWTNVGWFQLMEHEAGNTAENPAPALQKALAEFEKNDCSHQKLNAHLNLALAYQQQGQWPEARREFALAQPLAEHSTLLELLWQDDLAARAALHEGHPELALGLYEKLEKRSERAASPAGLLQALLGRANAHLALDQRPAAIGALAEADRQIEEQSQHIPVDQGRDTFFAYQEAVTRLYLKLLLDGGQQQRAFDLARKSRSRLLRQLAVRDRLSQLDETKQRAWIDSLSRYRAIRDAVEDNAAKRWKLADSEKEHASEDEARKLKAAQEELDSALGELGKGEGTLAPPARGEVILTYHPLPGKQWAAFAATEQGIEAATLDELPENVPAAPPEQLAHLLLAPSPAFQAAIASAKGVRVLPYGPLRTVDFHALPFAGGQPLLATHQVAYSLDLPRRSTSTPRSGQPLALVVANPTRDLRTAEAEGNTVVAAIKSWPGSWEPKLLNGSAAQAGEVRDALTRASFFHYAGHGSFGGFAGWSSELPLANESSLKLSDVLALSRVPDAIVLSACDAGRTSAEAPGEGVGLANAFLLAGAKEVVAARQLVPDASANELMTEMYRHWQPGEDLPHQLQRAQLACRKKDPSPKAAWASFRLLVP
ncbi:MAG TPA: CHAT domain-containing protein [Thermoanaerobaculia bacterium]|nr:CHAT domain-containing protein [Thermoanaerobaculia bacterium]